MDNSIPLHCRAALTPEEAAEYSGIGRNTILQNIYLADNGQGDFPFFRVGRYVKIPRQSLDAWIMELGKTHRTLRRMEKDDTEEQPKPKAGRRRMSAYDKMKGLD